ncbi:MAG: hypothetical protein V2A78_10210 [bacterium]
MKRAYQSGVFLLALGISLFFFSLTGAGFLLRAETSPTFGVDLNKVEVFTEKGAAEKSMMNWTDGYVTVKGLGLPLRKASPAQVKPTARRAAVVDGQRNLAETIAGVRVTSETTVKNMELQSDVVRTSLKAFVKGAEVLNEKMLPDGTCEVTMRAPIWGIKSLNEIILPACSEQEGMTSPPPAEPDTSPSGEEATGVVIVLPENRKANPALITEVYPEGQKEPVYDLGEVSPSSASTDGTALHLNLKPEKGPGGCRSPWHLAGLDLPSLLLARAAWADPVTRSKLERRAGKRPLFIQAVSARGKLGSAIVVSQKDAARITAANAGSGCLKDARVVVLHRSGIIKGEIPLHLSAR